MFWTNRRLYFVPLGVISIIFLLFLSYRQVFALSPSLEVRCCWALQESGTLVDECSELELNAERCTTILDKWDKTQTAWVVQTSPEYKIIPLVVVGLVVFIIWYLKRKK